MQEPGESDVAAMLRISGMPRQEVFMTAMNMAAVRERLYSQNDDVLLAAIGAAATSVH
jgi:hypothetical protein